MRFIYPVNVEQDEDGRYVISFPDIEEAVTDGATLMEALTEAQDALDEALAGRINHRKPIPVPGKLKKGASCVTPSAQMAAKAALYVAMLELGITRKVDLALKLDIDEKEARRLLDPHHKTKLPRIEAAIVALGKHLVLELQG